MRNTTCLLLIWLGLAGPVLLADARDTDKETAPYITTVEPSTAKAGDIVTAGGEALDKSQVAELYLTNGKDDARMEIIEQSSKLIRFKIPAGVASGRFRLMILSRGPEALLLEQPVFLDIE